MILLQCALLVFWAGPASSALSPQVPDEPSARETIDRLEEEWAEVYFERYPWLAIERGRPGALELGLANLGARGDRRWSSKLIRLQRDLDRLDRTGLDGTALLDMATLRASLAAERILFDARSPERWDADSHVRRVERMLLAIWFTTGEVAPRDRAVQKLCAEFPDYWARARSSLLSPREEWTQVALARLKNLERWLQNELGPEWLAGVSGAELTLRQATLDTALRSTAEFQTWLTEPHARAGGAVTRLGEARWLRLIQATSGTSWSVEEIRRHVLRDLAVAERTHGSRWRGRGARQKQATAGGDHEQRVRTLLDHGRACALWARDAGLGDLVPETELLVIPIRLPAPRATEVLFVRSSGSREALLTTEGTLEALDPAGLVVLGVRYGPLGLALLRRAGQGGEEKDSWGRGNRAMEEGWGLLVLDWLLDPDDGKGPFERESRDGRGEILAEVAWVQLLEGARLLASLELHALEYTREEAVEAFQRRTGVPYDEAAFEVQVALVDPQRGIGSLGWRELRNLEASLMSSPEQTANTYQIAIRNALKHRQRRPADLRAATRKTSRQ